MRKIIFYNTICYFIIYTTLICCNNKLQNSVISASYIKRTSQNNKTNFHKGTHHYLSKSSKVILGILFSSIFCRKTDASNYFKSLETEDYTGGRSLYPLNNENSFFVLGTDFNVLDEKEANTTLSKYDIDGEQLLSKKFLKLGDGKDLIYASGQKTAIIGETYEYSHNLEQDIYLMTLDNNLNKDFLLNFGHDTKDEAVFINQLNDHNFIILGNSYKVDHSIFPYAIKISFSGNQIWRYDYLTPGINYFRDAIYIGEKNQIIAVGGSDFGTILFIINSESGKIIDSIKISYDSGQIQGMGISRTTQNEVTITGYTSDFSGIPQNTIIGILNIENNSLFLDWAKMFNSKIGLNNQGFAINSKVNGSTHILGNLQQNDDSNAIVISQFNSNRFYTGSITLDELSPWGNQNDLIYSSDKDIILTGESILSRSNDLKRGSFLIKTNFEEGSTCTNPLNFTLQDILSSLTVSNIVFNCSDDSNFVFNNTNSDLDTIDFSFIEKTICPVPKQDDNESILDQFWFWPVVILVTLALLCGGIPLILSCKKKAKKKKDAKEDKRMDENMERLGYNVNNPGYNTTEAQGTLNNNTLNSNNSINIELGENEEIEYDTDSTDSFIATGYRVKLQPINSEI